MENPVIFKNMNPQKPFVSIIITCFNQKPYIKQAVESALNQSYLDLEVILVDDGSTDGSKQELEPFFRNSRFKYVYQKNGGVTNARNNGFKASKGVFIKYQDGDDFLYPLCVEKQVQDLISSKSGMSASRYKLLMPSGKIVDMELYIGKPEHQFADFIEANRSGGPASMLIKRSVIEDVDGFDEHMGNCADFDLWVRILQKGYHISTIDYHGYCYRVLPRSMSSDTKSMFVDKCRLYEKLNAEFLRKSNTVEQFAQRLMIINPKMIYECRARRLSLSKHLNNTMKMTAILYGQHKNGFERFAFGFLGVKNYSLFEYYVKNAHDKAYKERVLNEEEDWKYQYE